jgi:hypothetical protein
MKVRESLENFVVLPLPDHEARRRYENAVMTWERYSGDPDTVEINAEILASYTRACQAANLMNSASTGNWRYIRMILQAAVRNGVDVPYLRESGD